MSAHRAARTVRRNPLLTRATITGVVGAVLALLVAFNVDLTPDQEKALVGLAVALAPIVAGVWARFKVTPTAEVVAQINPAGPGTIAGQASPLPDGTPVGVTAVGPPPD